MTTTTLLIRYQPLFPIPRKLCEQAACRALLCPKRCSGVLKTFESCAGLALSGFALGACAAVTIRAGTGIAVSAGAAVDPGAGAAVAARAGAAAAVCAGASTATGAGAR